MKTPRWDPTPENFGKLARVWSGNLHAVKDNPWENFLGQTVQFAQTQVIAYSYIEPETRAQWALENSKEHTDYLHWQMLISQFNERYK